MVPAKSALQGPDLPRAVFGRRRDAAEIGFEGRASAAGTGAAGVLGCDAPLSGTSVGSHWIVGGLTGPIIEDKTALPAHRNGRQVRVGNQSRKHLAYIGERRIAHHL